MCNLETLSSVKGGRRGRMSDYTVTVLTKITAVYALSE